MKVSYHKKALKFLESNKDSKRLFEKIELLGENPFPKDAKRVAGYKEKIFRLRIGEYRAIYLVDYDSGIVRVLKIDKRGRVYK